MKQLMKRSFGIVSGSAMLNGPQIALWTWAEGSMQAKMEHKTV